jgi:hypothetical protein
MPTEQFAVLIAGGEVSQFSFYNQRWVKLPDNEPLADNDVVDFDDIYVVFAGDFSRRRDAELPSFSINYFPGVWNCHNPEPTFSTFIFQDNQRIFPERERHFPGG